jgi:hypothetical protein
MKKSPQLGSTRAVVFTLLTVTANTAFTSSLPITPGGSDWQAYYEDQLYSVWSANAGISPHESALIDYFTYAR